MNIYSTAGGFRLIFLLLIMGGFSASLFAEEDKFTPYLSNTELNALMAKENTPKPQLNYGFSLKGNLSGGYDKGIYQLKIDDLNLGWNGNNLLTDMKVIFSFRYRTNENSAASRQVDSPGFILGSFKDQLNKQNGIFSMSIGKSW